MAARQLIPEFYLQWLEPLTCDWSETQLDCRAVNCRGVRSASPSHKCCEYSPFLANFAIGRALDVATEDTARALSIGQPTPVGIFPAEQRHLCAYFKVSAGLCSIWRYRPGVCAAYYCSSSRGEPGLKLQTAVEAYLNLFEWTLAHEVLWRMGFTQDDLRTGSWFEYDKRPLDLYQEAANRANSVCAVEVKHLMGEEGEALRRQIRGLSLESAYVMPRAIPTVRSSER